MRILKKIIKHAHQILVDTANFDGLLSPEDTDVQKALEKIDDGISDHSTLLNLEFDNSQHTGFQKQLEYDDELGVVIPT